MKRSWFAVCAIGLVVVGLMLCRGGSRIFLKERVPNMHAETSRHPNRLIHEKSPYLLQHAYNPVDWYPWGAEAFAKAKQEDKPIFLSVGYSTCYWCHVMERESFENSEIAAQINASFVPVKVDREERPDIDAIYMSAVQAMAGQGGWPMTVLLTPDGQPFWGGTYLPPEDRWGRAGITTVLRAIAEAWKTRRDDILRAGQSVTQALQLSAAADGSSTPLTPEVLAQAVEQFADQYDPLLGGFGPAPKFPRSHTLSFLLRAWSRTKDAKALAMVESTLEAMDRGGLHDQLGGGFHRYSTDPQWLVPHFEKMLYDQALIARTYLEARQATGKAPYADVARDVFAYVLRDLRDEGGAFYSAEDAGEVGREGEFYVWTVREVTAALGEDDARLFMAVYGITPEGNFSAEHPGAAPSPGKEPVSIPHRPRSWDAAAREAGVSVEALEARMTAARATLLAARQRRPRPHRDDKILTDWNGLMIGALAYGGRALDEPAYTQAAVDAARFIRDRLQRDGHLLHRYRDGQAEVPAFLDDYAFLAWGLLDLYEATFDAQWLREAARLTRAMVEQFEDRERGGFLMSGQRNETLIAASKELYDGALPSGNSVATLVLVRLGQLTMDADLRRAADRSFQAFGAAARRMPSAFPQFLIAVDHWLGPAQEIVIAGDLAWPQTQQMRRAVSRRFLPRTVVALRPPGEAAEIVALVPFLKAQPPLQGQATAYVCRDYVCHLPVTDPARLESLLDDVSAGR